MHVVERAHERFQFGELGLGDPLRGEADVARLDDPPRLEQLDEGDAVLGEHEIEVRDQLLRARAT